MYLSIFLWILPCYHLLLVIVKLISTNFAHLLINTELLNIYISTGGHSIVRLQTWLLAVSAYLHAIVGIYHKVEDAGTE